MAMAYKERLMDKLVDSIDKVDDRIVSFEKTIERKSESLKLYWEMTKVAAPGLGKLVLNVLRDEMEEYR